MATLHLPTLVTKVVVGTHHLPTISQHLEFTQPYPRVGLLARATQEPHQWWATRDLDILFRELLVGSLLVLWFIHQCLLLPLQPYPTQFNQVQEWSTKINNQQLLDRLTRDKATLEGRTARV